MVDRKCLLMKVWQDVFGKGKEVQVHSCPQGTIQIATACEWDVVKRCQRAGDPVPHEPSQHRKNVRLLH